MKKILFFTVAFDTGGTEKVTFDIINHLDRKKYDITLMSIYGGGYYQEHLPPYVHVKHFFPTFQRFVIRPCKYLPANIVYKHFIKEKYDIEVACGDGLPSRLINASSNPHSKKYAWIHMDVIARGYDGWGQLTEYGKRTFYKNFDRVICVSYECEQQFRKKFGESYRTTVIRNAVDIKMVRELAQKNGSNALPENCFNIVAIGRLTEQKGFDRLIEAYSQLKRELTTPVHITIIGSGADEQALLSQISEADLEDDVTLTGYLENPYSLLGKSDLFALSSRDEAFALVVAEAISLGIPVLSTRCTGPTELLHNGEIGCLVDNSTEGIKAGLRQMIEDKEKYSYYKKCAQEHQDDYSIDNQKLRIEALFCEG